MYVPVQKCIWRTEINYLENKNGHSWVQPRWTVCNWGGVMVGLIYIVQLYPERWETTPNNIGYAILKQIVVRGSGYASHKNGDNVTLQKWSVLIL